MVSRHRGDRRGAGPSRRSSRAFCVTSPTGIVLSEPSLIIPAVSCALSGIGAGTMLRRTPVPGGPLRSRWAVLPASRRLWIMSGLMIVPAIVLMVLLAPFLGGTRYWTPTYVAIILVAFVIALIIWVRGTIRAVQEQRARRASRSDGNPGPGENREQPGWHGRA